MKNYADEIQELLKLYKSSNFIKAESFAKVLISKYPKEVILYNILGLIFTAQKKNDEAIKIYKEGINLDNNFAMFYNNLGTIYKSRKEYSIAENYYKKSISLDDSIPEPLNNLGNLYRAMNKDEEAIKFYKRAIKVNSKFFPAHFNIGITYKNNGKFNNAKTHLEEAINLNKDLFTAHRSLSEITKYTAKNNHFITLNKIHSDKRNFYINKKELYFALGKANDDIGDFKNAFNFFKKGNDLHRKNINFSLKDEKDEFSTIKKIFNKKLFSKYKENINVNNTAIFILGMPRSGTTLVEQILSSHPEVHGGGELNILTNIIKRRFRDVNEKILLKKFSEIDSSVIKNIGNEYINSLKILSPSSKKITDKMPINFKWIGLIKLILPKSTIIHCNRNPKDVCLSIFKNYFVNDELKYAYKLNEISGYFNSYKKLMDHWNKILGNFVYDLEYEKLIKNPKKEMNSLLNTCNLKWNDNCLNFYNNKRTINTASDTQARKKLYKTSINTWRNYNKEMKDFFSNLIN